MLHEVCALPKAKPDHEGPRCWGMYMYIYIYIYIFVCVYIYKCFYIHIYICVYTYIYIYININICFLPAEVPTRVVEQQVVGSGGQGSGCFLAQRAASPHKYSRCPLSLDLLEPPLWKPCV